MLKQRIITAIVLLAVLLATLSVPSVWPLLTLISVIAACATWEWLRLSVPAAFSWLPVLAGVVMGILLMLLAAALSDASQGMHAMESIYFLNQVVVPVVVVLWIVGATTAVLRANTEGRRHVFAVSAFGVVAVAALWIAIAQLFVAYGAWFLVSMMALIWVADSAAYFVGKAFGKHKLAPRISPGKTLEGALGGILGALVWMTISAFWDGSFAAVLVQRWGMPLMLLISALLAALSIVGDLFESLLKRRAGMKDSSQLLPGHGGVYDRIDALFPVAPLALLLAGT